MVPSIVRLAEHRHMMSSEEIVDIQCNAVRSSCITVNPGYLRLIYQNTLSPLAYGAKMTFNNDVIFTSCSHFYIKEYSVDTFHILIYISTPILSNTDLKVIFLGAENFALTYE